VYSRPLNQQVVPTTPPSMAKPVPSPSPSSNIRNYRQHTGDVTTMEMALSKTRRLRPPHSHEFKFVAKIEPHTGLPRPISLVLQCPSLAMRMLRLSVERQANIPTPDKLGVKSLEFDFVGAESVHEVAKVGKQLLETILYLLINPTPRHASPLQA